MIPAGKMTVGAVIIGRPLFCAAVWPATIHASAGFHTLHPRLFSAAAKTVPAIVSIIPVNWKIEKRADSHVQNARSKQYSTVALQRGTLVRKDNKQGIIGRISQRFRSSVRESTASTVTKNVENTSLNSFGTSESVETASSTVARNIEDTRLQSFDISEKAVNTTKELSKKTVSSSGVNTEEVDFEALVELEVELSRQDGHMVPSSISPSQWQELLTKKSFSARRHYLTFLFKNEMKRLNAKKRKEEKKVLTEKLVQEKKQREAENDHINYGLGNNTIFIKILDATMLRFYHGRVVQEIMFGQPLVLDMSYDEYMQSREQQNCADQVKMLIASNRQHKEPFHLHLCNASAQADTILRLKRFIPQILEVEYPLTVSSESYLDAYPRDKLIYLSPHCKEEMMEFNRDAVYIVGGIVDKSNNEPLSLAKAKREGIRMQKLPLDRYLDWGSGGSKSLTLNQMVEILLDFRITGDWNYALRHVPRRKVRGPMEPRQQEERLRRRLSYNRNRKFEWFDN